MLQRAQAGAVNTRTGLEPRFSDDGQWWWDGQSWVPALSPDRHWRWSGNVWEPIKPGSAAALVLVSLLALIPVGVVAISLIASADPLFFDVWVGLGTAIAAAIALSASFPNSSNPTPGSGAISALWGRRAYAVAITLGGAAGSLIAALLFPTTWSSFQLDGGVWQYLPTTIGGLLGAVIVLFAAGDFSYLRRLLGGMVNSFIGFRVRRTTPYSPPPSGTPARRLLLGLVPLAAILAAACLFTGVLYASMLVSTAADFNCIGQTDTVQPQHLSDGSLVFQGDRDMYFTAPMTLAGNWTISWQSGPGSFLLWLYDATVKPPWHSPWNAMPDNGTGLVARLVNSGAQHSPYAGSALESQPGTFCLTIESFAEDQTSADPWTVTVKP
jgi:hypothetical protein